MGKCTQKILLFLTLSYLTSFGGSHSAESNIFTIDTRSGVIVRGRILDGTPSNGSTAPLDGATVSVNGTQVLTSSDGTFQLNTQLDQSVLLYVSKAGYVGESRSVGSASSGTAIDLGTITLMPEMDGPIVKSVKLDPNWGFLYGLGMTSDLIVELDWNGTTPNGVSVLFNDNVVKSVSTSDSTVRIPIDIDSTFPSAWVSPYDLNVIAEDALSRQSEPLRQRVFVCPLPALLNPFLAYSVMEADEFSVEFKALWKRHEIKLPLLGNFGAECGVAGKVEYNMTDGEWDAFLGTNKAFDDESSGDGDKKRPYIFYTKKGSEERLYIGVHASSKGVAYPGKGFGLEEISGGLSLSDIKFEIMRMGLADAIGPGASKIIVKFGKQGEKLVKATSLALMMELSVSGEVTAAYVSGYNFDFKEFTAALGVDLTIEYAPDVGNLKAKFYVGGGATGTMGWPAPIFKTLEFRLYAGAEVEAWIFNFGVEYVFMNYTLERRLPYGAIPVEGGYLLPAAANATATLSPVARLWRDAGDEVFLLEPAVPGRRLSDEAEDALASADLFARMGNASSPGALYQPAAAPGRRLISDPDLPAQAELPLLSNVFPNSEPALAAEGNALMLLYLRDTGASNAVQFTEVAATRFDGTSWSAPAALFPTNAAQFAPQVQFDGQGSAVAVFEQVNDPEYADSDMEEYAGLMEIMWSCWDVSNQVWSTPLALTDNSSLDFMPQLAGPLADGDLIASWMNGTSNSISATTNTPYKVMAARWDAETGSWSVPEVLIASYANNIGEDLVAGGSNAYFVWSQDLDGDLDDDSDTELFYCSFDGVQWGAPVQFTSNAGADLNPRLCMNPVSGDSYLAWVQGSNLVFDVNFENAPALVRESRDNFGVADYTMTAGPNGNIALIWQEMSESGSDAHYRIYDPASHTWSLDTLLSQDSDLERDFSAVWDAVGNLTIAYNNVTISNETVSVEVDGGDVIDVDNVPQPGQVDLLVAKRALVNDLSVLPDSFAVEGGRFLPGDEVSLAVTVKNSGNAAQENVSVAFFDGNPAEDGTEIHREILFGWLLANETNRVEYVWTIPEPAQAHVLYAVIDPDGAVSEFSTANNVVSNAIGGVDLAVSLGETMVLRDGSAFIEATVSNQGTPASVLTSLSLADVPEASSGVSVGGITVHAIKAIEPINPGESRTVTLELPSGTQPQGQSVYNLKVDGANDNDDVNADNNDRTFVLLLWIDDDNDGLPESWETAHGMSDSDPDDGEQDLDEDGFTAAQEYKAGTDPQNESDYLHIGSFNVTQSSTGSANQFAWASADGTFYDVQRRFSLSSGGWETIAENVEATPPLNEVLDELPQITNSVFYRLIVK